jgi:hypothetical protein
MIAFGGIETHISATVDMAFSCSGCRTARCHRMICCRCKLHEQLAAGLCRMACLVQCVPVGLGHQGLRWLVVLPNLPAALPAEAVWQLCMQQGCYY